MTDLTERLLTRAALSGLAISSALLPKLAAYYDLLEHWNATINLTSLSDPDQAVDRLLLEPLAAASRVPAGARLIDLGSGGGSPAIPLALGCGATALVMVESRERKSAFLREAIRHLELAGASVESARFEDLAGREGFRGAFDAVSVRAVRVDSTTLAAAAGLVKSGGVAALFRGPLGPERLDGLSPELVFLGTTPLLRHSSARLTILTKR